MATVNNYFAQPGIAGDNVFVITGSLHINDILFTAEHIRNALASHDVTVYDSTAVDLKRSGIALIDGGTGFGPVTLEAPTIGSWTQIKVRSITSGSVTIKTLAGVTFDGTNNLATFDAIDDELVLGYKSATEWYVITNNSVALSSV